MMKSQFFNYANNKELFEKKGIMVKWEIVKNDFPIDGKLNWNVAEYRCVDGKRFYYCGTGKFCKTKKECLEYIENRKKMWAE